MQHFDRIEGVVFDRLDNLIFERRAIGGDAKGAVADVTTGAAGDIDHIIITSFIMLGE